MLNLMGMADAPFLCFVFFGSFHVLLLPYWTWKTSCKIFSMRFPLCPFSILLLLFGNLAIHHPRIKYDNGDQMRREVGRFPRPLKFQKVKKRVK